MQRTNRRAQIGHLRTNNRIGRTDILRHSKISNPHSSRMITSNSPIPIFLNNPSTSPHTPNTITTRHSHSLTIVAQRVILNRRVSSRTHPNYITRTLLLKDPILATRRNMITTFAPQSMVIQRPIANLTRIPISLNNRRQLRLSRRTGIDNILSYNRNP